MGSGGGASSSDIQRGGSFKQNPCSLKLKQFVDLMPGGTVFPVVASRRVFSQVDHSQPGGERLCWRILPLLPGERVGLLACFDHSAMIKYPNKKKEEEEEVGNGRIDAFDNAARINIYSQSPAGICQDHWRTT